MHPHAPGGVADDAEVAERLSRCDGLLLPGGGDISPSRYAEGDAHEAVYDVDDAQDAFDFALARAALASGLPTLAVCRGLQVVNTVLGGTLRQDMGGREHRHVVHPARVTPGSLLGSVLDAEKAQISCYHHQCADRLGGGLTVTATAADGTVEALELTDAKGWFLAVQWHPEDTAAMDTANQAVFDTLVTAARR